MNTLKNVNTNYIVTIYKDMKLASDIDICVSFENNFQAAFKFYKRVIQEKKNKQYVALELEVEKEFKGTKCLNSEYIFIADNCIE